MTGKAKALVLRMVVCAIEGETGKLKSLHERYTKESRLHVSIGEILREQQPWMHYILAYHATEDDAAKKEIAAAVWEDLGEQLRPVITKLQGQVELLAAYLPDYLKQYARIMQEPPRPGRGVI